MSPKEIAEKFEDKFYMKGEDRGLYLPKGHHYYAQVQGELAVLGREWCDFVVYSNGQVVVDRIFSDLEYWNQLEETLEKILCTFCYSRDIIWRNIPGRVWFIFVACLLYLQISIN